MTLHTRISPAGCKALLLSAVDAERFAFTTSGYAGSKPIIGRIGEDTFRLQKRRSYRNSFAPMFYGRFSATNEGTTIEGRFRLHPAVKAFMFFWFSFLAMFFFIALFSGNPKAPGAKALLIIDPLVMAAFGVGLIQFGRWLSRNEEKAILELLKNTLEANEVTPSPPTKN